MNLLSRVHSSNSGRTLAYLLVLFFGGLDQTSGDEGIIQLSLTLTHFTSRRLSFNVTLFITGVFALAGGSSPDSITLCSLAAVWSIGVGGNLPVDSAIFLGMSTSNWFI